MAEGQITILDAMADENVFGHAFRDAESWRAWTAFLAALFGLPLDDEAQAIFRDCTGRSEPPAEGVGEAWLVIGRRGGKSFVLATIAVFLACFRDWRPYLAPGELGTVMVIAADRRQARVILRYVRGLLNASAMLKAQIKNNSAETIELANSVCIEVHTASWRTTRGYTVVAGLCDELAFWRADDSANPDTEILNAIRPAMATIPGALLLCASSPYARRGALYRAWQKHFGKDDDKALVWQASTRTMNPKIPERIISEAFEDDPISAAAEYGAQFRSDVESFVSLAVVEACTIVGRHELPRDVRTRYTAFVDPSGGTSDSMTLAIAHLEGGERAVLDCVREVRAPFSPESVVKEFVETLDSYGCHRVTGDRYAGEWPREAFRRRGITYEASERSKSDLYGGLLPMLNSGRVNLLDDQRLRQQLINLERRTSRGGRDLIDHPPGAHDDLANAVAGALVSALNEKSKRGVMRVTTVRAY
ncbi:terminase family protein [Methyloceanibacter sp.]|uniref:terminase large subunit domain-containing protein n=1 Tax=Methyloceanibacter sp. TaxID=1965321 RepID=UPI0025FD74DF|nr:terminase family protein [Methyloceanibacter sp.]